MSDTNGPKAIEQCEKATLHLWTPSVVGWTTILLGFGGFLLAYVNWCRMGLRRKAVKRLVFGIILAIGATVANYFFNERFPLPPEFLYYSIIILKLVLLFIVVAYLYKVTERDIARVGGDYILEPASVPTAVGIAILATLGWIIVGTGVRYGVAYLRIPKVESSATLITGGVPAIRGELFPWTDEAVSGRKLVLCAVITETKWKPYDCRLTRQVALSDDRGEFRFDSVPPGEYFIFYDSGMVNFESGVEQWEGTVFELGNFRWLYAQDLWRYTIVSPEDFENFDRTLYRYHVEYTLAGQNSPFVVAHNIERALAFQFKYDPMGIGERVPPGVFEPTMVEVVEGYTSVVEFDVLVSAE
ncbi:MAG: hypothetical protein GY845_15350 [Planctomycetes bacterium]|nr:hypothetical protein [Planctomycetota bacterium]